MISLENQVYVTIKLDGQDLGFGPDSLQSLTLTEGNGALTPAFKLVLMDKMGKMDNLRALTDANAIEVIVSKSPTDMSVAPRKYRVFASQAPQTPSGAVITIVAVHDAPKYLMASTVESFEGTSDKICRSVAAKCGLKYSGPIEYNGREMADEQIWRNSSKTRATWLSEAVRHCYMDNHSAMAVTLDSYGELKFRNFIDVIHTPIEKIKYAFLHNHGKNHTTSSKDVAEYSVLEAKDRSTAGVMNAWHNYGSTKVIPKLSGETTKLEKLGVKMPGKYLPINSDIKKEVDRARHEYGVLDCGNTHENYHEAQYQNIKQLALFSEKMSILTLDVTEVQLFEPVIYRQAGVDYAQPVKNTDVYIVVGKTIQVLGTHYAERIELVRMSLNMAGQAKLSAPTTAPSEKSLIPDVKIDMSALASAADSLKSLKNVKSLDSLVSTLKNGLSRLDNLQSGLTGAIGGVLGAVGNVQALAGQVQGMVGQVQGVVSAVQTNVSEIKGVVDNLRSNALPDAVKNLVLTQTGSALDSIAKTVQFSNVVNNVNALASVNGVANAALGSAATALTSATSEMWNTAVSGLKGVDIPSSISSAASGSKISALMNAGASYNTVASSIKSELVNASSSVSNFINTKDLTSMIPTTPTKCFDIVSKNLGTIDGAEA